MPTFKCPHIQRSLLLCETQVSNTQFGSRPQCVRCGCSGSAFGDHCRASLSSTSGGQRKPTRALRTKPRGPYQPQIMQTFEHKPNEVVHYLRHACRSGYIAASKEGPQPFIGHGCCKIQAISCDDDLATMLRRGHVLPANA